MNSQYGRNVLFFVGVANLSTVHRSWTVLSQDERDQQQQRANRIRELAE